MCETSEDSQRGSLGKVGTDTCPICHRPLPPTLDGEEGFDREEFEQLPAEELEFLEWRWPERFSLASEFVATYG